MDRGVIILGDSPFIKKVENKIEYVLDRYYSIGINNVITKYYTNAHIFVDRPFIALTNTYIGKTISLKSYENFIHKDDKELFELYPIKLDEFNAQSILSEDKIEWCGFTHDFAISYCIKKGYKKIILLGTGDFASGSHYSTPYTFKYSSLCRNKSKRFIEEYASKVAEIVTCNPDSALNIPKVNIDDLLV